MRQDYYRLLDVHRDASAAELKRAYEVALSRANRDGATKHMVDLVKAYEVLSDPRRRRVYDETGLGVVPERVPNTYGRAVPWRGGSLGLRSNSRGAVGSTVLPAARKGPSRSFVIAVASLAVIASALAVLAVAGGS